MPGVDKIALAFRNFLLVAEAVPVAWAAQDSTKGVRGSLSDIASFPDDRRRANRLPVC